jgi:hypothetical protein
MNPEHHIYHFLNKKDAQQKADVSSSALVILT